MTATFEARTTLDETLFKRQQREVYWNAPGATGWVRKLLVVLLPAAVIWLVINHIPQGDYMAAAYWGLCLGVALLPLFLPWVVAHKAWKFISHLEGSHTLIRWDGETLQFEGRAAETTLPAEQVQELRDMKWGYWIVLRGGRIILVGHSNEAGELIRAIDASLPTSAPSAPHTVSTF